MHGLAVNCINKTRYVINMSLSATLLICHCPDVTEVTMATERLLITYEAYILKKYHKLWPLAVK